MGYRGGIGIEMENKERNMKDWDGGKEKSKGRKIEREEKLRGMENRERREK